MFRNYLRKFGGFAIPKERPILQGALALGLQISSTIFLLKHWEYFKACTKPASAAFLTLLHCCHQTLPRFFGSFLLNLSCVSVSLYFHKFRLSRTSFNSDCDKLWNRRFCELGALVCCCLLCCGCCTAICTFPFHQRCRCSRTPLLPRPTLLHPPSNKTHFYTKLGSGHIITSRSTCTDRIDQFYHQCKLFHFNTPRGSVALLKV